MTTKRLIDAELDEMEERAEKATPGPWECGVAGNAQIVRINDCNIVPVPFTMSDLRFIAHSRDDMTRLLADLRAAREALQTIERKVAWIVLGDCDVGSSGFASQLREIHNTAQGALPERGE